MRCDANETCWGNTVLCILRCAFWNRNRFIHILDFCFLFLFFSAGFSFSCLSVFLSRFGQVKKEREQASHAFIIIIIIIIPERGWGGAERAWSNLCLFLVIWGKYRGLFPPSSRAGFLYSSLVVVFLQPTIPKPPCSISCQRDPHPRAPEAPGSLSHPPSSLLVKHAAGHAGTKGEERVVFSSEWFGRDGGVEGGQGCVSMGLWEGERRCRKRETSPFLPKTKPSAEILTLAWGSAEAAAATGMDRQDGGLLAWIWSQGKKFAMLTCDEQEVSAQLGLSLSAHPSLDEGGERETGQPRIKSGKKRNRGKPQSPTSSLPTDRESERQLPSFERLETRRLLVQSLLFISQRHNHTEYFFPSPFPHDHTCRLPSLTPSPGGRLAWCGSQPLGAEGIRSGGPLDWEAWA